MLCLCVDADGADGRCGISADAFQEGIEMVCQAFDGGAVEQVRGVVQQELDAVGVAENYLPVCIRKGWVMSSRNR